VKIWVANDLVQKKLLRCNSRYEYIRTPVYKRWHASTNKQYFYAVVEGGDSVTKYCMACAHK